MPKEGDLKVWWIPQIPMKSFMAPVKNIDEAKLILDVLGAYDYFQFKNKVKPDYSNTGGLLVYEDKKWIEWYNDEGNDIATICKQEDPPQWLKEVFKK